MTRMELNILQLNQSEKRMLEVVEEERRGGKMRIHSQKLVSRGIMEYLREVQKLILPLLTLYEVPRRPCLAGCSWTRANSTQNFPRILTFAARRWNRGGRHKYFRNWNPSQLGVFSIILISMLKASCRSQQHFARSYFESNQFSWIWKNLASLNQKSRPPGPPRASS